VTNPTMVSLGAYQQDMLTRELTGLWEADLLQDVFIDDVRTRYGATHTEVQDILNSLEGVSHGRAA